MEKKLIGNDVFLDCIAWHGELSKLKELLSTSPASLHATDWKGWTPLHFASDAGRLEVVRWLLEQSSIKIDAKDEYDQTPLFSAIISGSGGHNPSSDCLAVARLLLEHGASVQHRSKSEMTPLHYAAFHNRLPFVKLLLLDFKAEINAVNDIGETPTDCATEDETLAFLKEHGGELVFRPKLEEQWAEREAAYEAEIAQEKIEEEEREKVIAAEAHERWMKKSSVFLSRSGSAVHVSCDLDAFQKRFLSTGLEKLRPLQHVSTNKGRAVLIGLNEAADRLYAKVDVDAGVSYWNLSSSDDTSDVDSVLSRNRIAPVEAETPEQRKTAKSIEGQPWVLKLIKD